MAHVGQKLTLRSIGRFRSILGALQDLLTLLAVGDIYTDAGMPQKIATER